MIPKDITAYLVSIRTDAGSISADALEALPYENRSANTRVEIRHPEFTSLCPKTGLPDYGSVRIVYVPDRAIVELKSLKYYFLQYRNSGIFYENLTPLILKHLVDRLQPLEMTVEAEFTPRGGLSSKVTSSYRK
jgi:7-cyano-7-deazaguanine reductase